MSKHLNSRASWKSVVCPFFNGDESGKVNAVYCEGTEINTNVRQTFDTKENFNKWERKYCRDILNYRFCPLFKVVCAKYEDERPPK